MKSRFLISRAAAGPAEPTPTAAWVARAGLWVLAGWSFLLAYRLLFSLVFFQAETLPAVSLQFLRGLRFDLATLPLLVGPVLLFEPVCIRIGTAQMRSAAVRFVVVGQALWFGLSVLLLGAGFLQYAFNQKYPGPEFYTYYTDAAVIVGGLLRKDGSLLGLAILPGFLLLALWLVAIRRREKSRADLPPLGIRGLLFSRVLLLGLLALLLRGGWQASPLRPADALNGTSAYLSHIPLNALFTLYHAARETGDFPVFFAGEQNVQYVQNLYDLSAKEKAYPLLAELPAQTHPVFLPAASARQPSRTSSANRDAPRVFRPHIVLVLLESFSAVFLAENGGSPGQTPHLSRLSQQSLYFPRFFSAGGRSANAIFSLLTGIPDRAGRTILRSPGIQNRFGALPRLLGNVGYRSYFLHGGDLRFDSLDRILPRFGFDRVAGRPGAADISDEQLFQDALGLIDAETARSPAPVFTVLFTVGTHHPFQEGPVARRIRSGNTPADRLRNAVAHSDQALGHLIEAARARPWFDQTVFVIVADHSHHAGLNFLQDLHLPLLFYAPGLLPEERRGRVGTHLDLHATLFALAGGGGNYAALGRDLLAAKDPAGGGFFAGGSRTDVIGWIGEDRLCFVWPGRERAALYDSRLPADAFQRNFVEPRRLAECSDRARHVYQLARDLERTNRVWPPEDRSK